MSLLDKLKRTGAHAADVIKNLAELSGSQAAVSVVISHPGTAEDAIIIGDHEIAELFAILARLETMPRVECDVTSTAIGPDELIEPRSVQ
jgi:hypothetical protein